MGNIQFASLNQSNFMRTSRRDDLISLLYLMVFMLNDGTLFDHSMENSNTLPELFEGVKSAK